MENRSFKIKLSLQNEEKKILLETMKDFSTTFNFYSKWSNQNNSTSKIKAHKETYELSKGMFNLPTALIQSARDMALEANKNKKKKQIPCKKQYSSIRYDSRTFTLRNSQLTISSKEKRIKTIIQIPKYAEKYFNEWNLLKTGYLCLRGKNLYFTFIFSKNIDLLKNDGEIVGIDRGIINIVSLSDGVVVKGNDLRKNKRKHLFLKRKLQAKGTRSAKKSLKMISGKEKRFSLNLLHRISKQLANKPNVKIYVLENLVKIKSKSYNKKSNKVVGNWGFKSLENLLSYKCKEKGIDIQFVDARFTSQICSTCGTKDKSARNKGKYICKVCNLKIHSDLNAAINIKNRFVLNSSSNKEFEAGCSLTSQTSTDLSVLISSRPCAVSS